MLYQAADKDVYNNTWIELSATKKLQNMWNVPQSHTLMFEKDIENESPGETHAIFSQPMLSREVISLWNTRY